MIKNSRHNWFGTLFPFYPYTIWFVKNLGLKNFLKNIDVFFSQNIGGGFALMIAITMLIKKKFSY